MASIKGKNTKPELLLRRGLHAKGLRYRLHDRSLPGQPDMIFPRHDAVLFAHGCFWHGHPDCHLFKWPKTRPRFWRRKIGKNIRRDETNVALLLEEGWRTGIVWECALKGKTRLPYHDVISQCHEWVLSDIAMLDIEGKTH